MDSPDILPTDVFAYRIAEYLPLDLLYSLGPEYLSTLISETQRRASNGSLEPLEVALKNNDEDMLEVVKELIQLSEDDFQKAVNNGYPHVVRLLLDTYGLDLIGDGDNSSLGELIILYPNVLLSEDDKWFELLGSIANDLDVERGIQLLNVAEAYYGILNDEMIYPILISHLLDEKYIDYRNVAGEADKYWSEMLKTDNPLESLHDFLTGDWDPLLIEN